MIVELKTCKYPGKQEWEALQRRAEEDVSPLFDMVRNILEDVRRNGDEAVRKYGERFDKVYVADLSVSQEEMEEAETLIDKELMYAMIEAKRNIEMFHAHQYFDRGKTEIKPGITCWQKSVAIEKVGLYIPGGTAPLFSTVLMLAVPAVMAGCKEVALCTPPNSEGKVHPAILYAAKLAGVSKIVKAGGVQAIAAMTYGTESVSKVYKIFGPGNQYVVAAKQLVSLTDVAIDMPAGPSEVEIIADEAANPAYVAADFLAQAEHGTDSQSVLVTTSETLVEAVKVEIEKQLSELPRRDFIEKSLLHSRIIILKDDAEMIEFTNQYAPEHLIIQTANYVELSSGVVNAGSVFLGPYTTESAGDYASGTNHTLPTKGYAKMYSGVNLDSFMRKITFQEITEEGLRTLASTIEVMAENEQLLAHRNTVTVRVGNKQ
ncbi:MAG: histidinol dehydrogenase [Tannerella sp.]|jgi:histidinol dehydrogenase|nr:histidinol dehydrogenase [Tannerella sp.]